MYLTRIETKGLERTYAFDRAYNGYRIVLSQQIKERLGINHLLEITVRNDQILNVKVCILEIEPDFIGGEIQSGQLRSEYVDPINEALAMLAEQGLERIQFEAIKVTYLITDLSNKIEMRRGIRSGDTWYYP